jgi:uncharacterized membrane protein YczE
VLANWRTFPLLMLGFMVFGFGISLIRRASLGLDPWSAFAQGLSNHLPLSFGLANTLSGLAILLLGLLLYRQRIDWGTLGNMLLIGPWVDFFYPLVPDVAASSPLAGMALLLAGITLIGVASGMYISSRWGAGPRDGFVLAAAARSGRSVRLVRTLLEVTVLCLGVLMGAPAGIGTVLFALLIGPAVQAGLKLFRALPERPTVFAPASAD